MAKRKKTTTRRRVSGVSKKGTTDALVQIGGALAGNIAANMIGSSLLPTMTGTVKGAIFTAGGLLINSMVKDPMIKAVGIGVAINGGTTLLGPTGLNVISGTRRVGAQRVVRRGRSIDYGQQGVIGRNGRYLTDAIAGPGVSGIKTGGSFSSSKDFDSKQDFA